MVGEISIPQLLKLQQQLFLSEPYPEGWKLEGVAKLPHLLLLRQYSLA